MSTMATGSWQQVTGQLMQASADRRVPFMGAFELTARCNLRCSMCYVRQDENEALLAREKTAEEWIGLGRAAVRAGTLFLLLTGGEPFLRPDFREIYMALKQMGLIITIYTNATLIDDRTAAWLGTHPPNKMGVTLYGAGAETCARVTGSDTAFDRAVAGVDRLLRHNIAVELRATITRDNVGDKKELDALAARWNRPIQFASSLVAPVRGAASRVRAVRLSPQDSLDFEEQLCLADAGQAGSGFQAPGQTRADPDPAEQLPAMRCYAGKNAWWTGWDGRMLPCAMMSAPSADPWSDGFLQAWRQLVTAVDQIRAPDACQNCPDRAYCKVCPGMLQAETGSFETVSPYFCRQAALLSQRFGQTLARRQARADP